MVVAEPSDKNEKLHLANEQSHTTSGQPLLKILGGPRIWIKRGNRSVMKNSKGHQGPRGAAGDSSTVKVTATATSDALQRISEATMESSSTSSIEEQSKRPRHSRSPGKRREKGIRKNLEGEGKPSHPILYKADASVATPRPRSSAPLRLPRPHVISETFEDAMGTNVELEVGCVASQAEEAGLEDKSSNINADASIASPTLRRRVAERGSITSIPSFTSFSTNEDAINTNSPSPRPSSKVQMSPRESTSSIPSLSSFSTYDDAISINSPSTQPTSKVKMTSRESTTTIPSLSSFSTFEGVDVGSESASASASKSRAMDSTLTHSLPSLTSSSSNGQVATTSSSEMGDSRTSFTSMSVELKDLQPTSELTLLGGSSSTNNIKSLSVLTQGSTTTLMSHTTVQDDRSEHRPRDRSPKPAQRIESPASSRPRLGQFLSPSHSFSSWRSETSLVGQHLVNTPDLNLDGKPKAIRPAPLVRGVRPQKSSESMAYSEDSVVSFDHEFSSTPSIKEELFVLPATSEATKSVDSLTRENLSARTHEITAPTSEISPITYETLALTAHTGTSPATVKKMTSPLDKESSPSGSAESHTKKSWFALKPLLSEGIMLNLVHNIDGGDASEPLEKSVVSSPMSSLQMSHLGSHGGTSLGSSSRHLKGIPAESSIHTTLSSSQGSVSRSKARFAALLQSDDFVSSVSTASTAWNDDSSSWAFRSARSHRQSVYDHPGANSVRSKSERRRSITDMVSTGSSGTNRAQGVDSGRLRRNSLKGFIIANNRSMSNRQLESCSSSSGTGSKSSKFSLHNGTETIPMHKSGSQNLRTIEDELSESLHSPLVVPGRLSLEHLESTRFSAPPRLNRVRSPRRRVQLLANHLQKERSEHSEASLDPDRSHHSLSHSQRSTSSGSVRPPIPLPPLSPQHTPKRRTSSKVEDPISVDSKARTVRRGNRTLDQLPEVAASKESFRNWSSSPIPRRYRVIGLPPFVEDNENSSVSSGSTSALSERDYLNQQRRPRNDDRSEAELSAADTIGLASWRAEDMVLSNTAWEADLNIPMTPRHRGQVLVQQSKTLQTIESVALSEAKSKSPLSDDVENGGVRDRPIPHGLVAHHRMNDGTTSVDASEHSSIGPLTRMDEGFRSLTEAVPPQKRLPPLSIPVTRTIDSVPVTRIIAPQNSSSADSVISDMTDVGFSPSGRRTVRKLDSPKKDTRKRDKRIPRIPPPPFHSEIMEVPVTTLEDPTLTNAQAAPMSPVSFDDVSFGPHLNRPAPHSGHMGASSQSFMNLLLKEKQRQQRLRDKLKEARGPVTAS